jgi:hypothetical protein
MVAIFTAMDMLNYQKNTKLSEGGSFFKKLTDYGKFMSSELDFTVHNKG